MKVRVIGSGSMWNAYNSASYMVDEDILVDMPNGMCKYLFRMNINPMMINNVLITHFHGDHYFDMPFYMLLKARANNRVINMYCYKKGKKKIERLFVLAFPLSVDNVLSSIKLSYCDDDVFTVNNYSVGRVILNHGRFKPAYGYIFEKDGKRFGFTGDTTYCENVEKMANVCSYLFCDCMFIKGTDKHMGIDNLTKLADKYPKCKFVVSHMEDITREELSKQKIKNVIVPKDGDVFEIK